MLLLNSLLNNSLENKAGFLNTSEIISSKKSIENNQTVTYIADKNCCVIVEINVTYSVSGSFSIMLNNLTIYSSTSKQNSIQNIMLAKGDTLKMSLSSSSTSYYTVYGLK